MGNTLDSGFNAPPPSFLREIRRKTNRRFRDIATSRKRRNSSREFSRESITTRKKFGSQALTDLNTDSVKDFVISNPDFLDDLIATHISQDRVRAWLRETKDSSEDGVKKESDPDFMAELMERSFRHRQILLITRSRILFPNRLERDELSELIERPYSDEYENEIESHLFPYTEIQVEDINKIFICMVNKLLGKHAFPMPELCYFLSTLKSNYNNIEYHNYSHALSHTQSMYWILRKNPGMFSELEVKCLMIASISHDVGHPGLNDTYLKTTGGGLDKMYHTPILEHHHIQICFLILQDISCNVFCDLEGEDYKQVLDEIQHAILSTSLNRYKVQCENMRHIIATDLNFGRSAVRDATKSVLMMTCDLCASWKAWQEHKSTVWSLYKEFFSQGDKEMHFQMDSIPQMMRMNADKIPEYQVFFMENVILPVFQIAVKIFPNISDIINCTEEFGIVEHIFMNYDCIVLEKVEFIDKYLLYNYVVIKKSRNL